MGDLNIIIGPMYSGKSTKLIKIYHKNQSKKICVINYSGDNRYSTNALSTHDGKKIESLKLSKLDMLRNKKLLIIMICLL